MSGNRKPIAPSEPPFFASPDGLSEEIRAAAVVRGMKPAELDVLSSASRWMHSMYGSFRICAELDEVVEAWGLMTPDDFEHYNFARAEGVTHAQALEAVRACGYMYLYLERLRVGDEHDEALEKTGCVLDADDEG
ncbi:hypothetical protein ACRYCC_09690 [Actinomadura scrupuli]|uniref:hypothetical protein n=1 Tax=Actinomadura scrupuli TaxID=559629 RepID=UPI003D99CCAC